MEKLIAPFKKELTKKNQVISIVKVCNKDRLPEDKVITPNNTLIMIGLLNFISKSTNTINEKIKIEKYNL